MRFFPTKLISIGLSLLLLTGDQSTKAQYAVRGEFAYQPNGLIYPDSCMRALGHMVDSLNLRFKVCDLSRTYYSYPQGRIFMIRFADSVTGMKPLRRDLDDNMSIGDLLKKYKALAFDIDTVETLIKISDATDTVDEFLTGTPGKGYGSRGDMQDAAKRPITGRWFYHFSKKDKYSTDNVVDAYLIPEPLVQRPIPEDYARYLQYVDCMVDTNSQVMLAKRGIPPYYEVRSKKTGAMISQRPEVDRLNDYVNRKMKLKKKDEIFDFLSAEKIQYACDHLNDDTDFRRLLIDAVDTAMVRDNGTEGLEEMTASYLSKTRALDLMRHRQVIGICSQDRSPRLHALKIAEMAAQCNAWDIFLRAHLDIMCDHFQRMSDGSYAYGQRKTYLKELEVLNLDVVDLMLGLGLRASNHAENHYNGTVWRLGWAMGESKNQALFEEKLQTMMKDERLDEFNRGLAFIMYSSYLRNLENMDLANKKILALKETASQYPASLQTDILGFEERKKEAK